MKNTAFSVMAIVVYCLKRMFKMIENKKYKLDEHYELRHRIGNVLYYWGVSGNFELSEKDIQWIEINITSHRLFRAIDGKVYGYGHLNYAYAVEFFLMFLDAPKIPSQTNKLLYYVIGICKEYDKLKYGAPEPTRDFFIKKWMEKCR